MIPLNPRGLQPVSFTTQRSLIQRLIDAIQLSLISSKLPIQERARRSRLLTREFPRRQQFMGKQIIAIMPPCIFFDDGSVECAGAPRDRDRLNLFRPVSKVPGFK